MRAFFYVVFYKFYTLLKAEYNAMYLLMMLITLNLGSLYGYYQCLINHSNNIVPLKIITISTVALLCLIGYFTFIRGSKYSTICRIVEESEVYKKGKVGMITFLYVLVTIAFLSGLIFLDCK